MIDFILVKKSEANSLKKRSLRHLCLCEHLNIIHSTLASVCLCESNQLVTAYELPLATTRSNKVTRSNKQHIATDKRLMQSQGQVYYDVIES